MGVHMSRIKIVPTGVERRLGEEQIIVSKTDVHGKIMYANRTFLEISSFTEEEVIGQPHSMVRHPDMPRSVFKLLWDTLESGQEIFAYVVNLAKNGDHYWVLAHVTPTFGPSGEIVGFHSNRRAPDRKILPTIMDVYSKLRAEESRFADKRQGMEAATKILMEIVQTKAPTYEQFIATI
jgi:PAS domain S-box-containing protein